MLVWHKTHFLNLSSVGMKWQQAVAGISHISFGDEEGVSPKKPTTIPEVAKQRELSGTLESEAEKEARLKKQLSDSKFKELSGHDIFAPPPEILPRTTTAPRALALKGSIEIGEPASPNGHTSVKVSNVSELCAYLRIIHIIFCSYYGSEASNCCELVFM